MDDEREWIPHKRKNDMAKEQWVCLSSEEGISMSEILLIWMNNWANSSSSDMKRLSCIDTQRWSLVGKIDLSR